MNVINYLNGDKLKISIHQPEHFPYEGFFQKMKKSDIFVILDNVNYRKNYFHNRNKIKNKNSKDEWFGFPVDKNKKLLNEITTNDKVLNWRRKVTSKLRNNLNVNLEEIYKYNKLIDINMSSIEWCRKKLNINTPIVFASELNVSGKKSELLLNICKSLNAKDYISGPSGSDYLNIDLFKENNIEVEIFQPNVTNYYSMLYNILS